VQRCGESGVQFIASTENSPMLTYSTLCTRPSEQNTSSLASGPRLSGIVELGTTSSGDPVLLQLQGEKLDNKDRLVLVQGDCSTVDQQALSSQISPQSVSTSGTRSTWNLQSQRLGNFSACWCSGWSSATEVCTKPGEFAFEAARLQVVPRTLNINMEDKISPCSPLVIVAAGPTQATTIAWRCEPSSASMCQAIAAASASGKALTIRLNSSSVEDAAKSTSASGVHEVRIKVYAEVTDSAGRVWFGAKESLFAASHSHSLWPLEGKRVFEISDATIGVTARMTNCGTYSTSTMITLSWSWQKQGDSSWTDVKLRQQSALSLALPISELRGPGSYTIRGQANSAGSQLVVDFKVQLVETFGPKARIMAPAKTGAECSFELDATWSSGAAGGSLAFSWRCSSSSVFQSEACTKVVSSLTSPTVSIPGGTLLPGLYSFTVSVAQASASGVLFSNNATAAVVLQEAVVPAVALQDPPVEVSGQLPFQIAVTVSASSTCSAPPWSNLWAVSARKTSGTLLSQVKGVLGPTHTVSPLALSPGRYFLRLVLSDIAGASWDPQLITPTDSVTDSALFTVDAAPTEGLVVIKPHNGTALDTTFLAQSVGWIDDDLPLRHRFSSKLGSAAASVTWTPLRAWSEDQDFHTVFGVVGEHTVRAEVQDTLGSISAATASLHVEPAPPASTSKVQERVANIASSGSSPTVVAAVNAAAQSQQSQGGNATKKAELASFLINTLQSSGSLTQPSADAIDTTATALNNILVIAKTSSASSGSTSGTSNTNAGGQTAVVNMGVATKAASLTVTMVNASLSILGTVSTTVAQKLLGSVGALVGTASTSGTSGNSVASGTANASDYRKKQASLTHKLYQATNLMGDALVAKSKPGATIKIQAPEVTLEVVKADVTELATNSSSVGSFTLPPLGAAVGRRLGSCANPGISLQNVKWQKNPYGYAGSQGSSTASQREALRLVTKDLNATLSNSSSSETRVLNSSSTCCQIDQNSVEVMEVRSCGANMKVENLPEPVIFQLVFASSGNTTEVRTYDPNLQYMEITTRELSTAVCQYWDEAQSSWTDKGCWILQATEDRITCACSHLTTFAAAATKAYTSLGTNNAGLLLLPHTIDFGNTMFQVVLGWFVILYIPLFCQCYFDFKEFPWLSQRSDLFKDKVPKSTPDYMALIMPPFRLCYGFIMCAAIEVNISRWKRRLTWCFCGGPCMKYKEEIKIDVDHYHRKDMWVSHLGVEASAIQFRQHSQNLPFFLHT